MQVEAGNPMDFLDRLLDFIEDHIDLEKPITVGKLGTKSGSISLRQTPAANIDRYADGDETFEYSFQITMKDKDQIKVINKLNEITKLLNGLSNSAIPSEDGSFVFVKCEVNVRPNWVEETERGNHMYTALFTAELGGGI